MNDKDTKKENNGNCACTFLVREFTINDFVLYRYMFGNIKKVAAFEVISINFRFCTSIEHPHQQHNRKGWQRQSI